MQIKTQLDWWKAVFKYWNIFKNNYRDWYDNEFRPPWLYHLDPNLIEGEKALKSRDWEGVHSFLHTIWTNLPDRQEIHSLPGFNQLCDILSETWVFEEDEVITNSMFEELINTKCDKCKGSGFIKTGTCTCGGIDIGVGWMHFPECGIEECPDCFSQEESNV